MSERFTAAALATLACSGCLAAPLAVPDYEIVPAGVFRPSGASVAAPRPTGGYAALRIDRAHKQVRYCAATVYAGPPLSIGVSCYGPTSKPDLATAAVALGGTSFPVPAASQYFEDWIYGFWTIDGTTGDTDFCYVPAGVGGGRCQRAIFLPDADATSLGVRPGGVEPVR